VRDVGKLAADLHADIDVFVRIAREAVDQSDRVERMKTLMFDHLSSRLDQHGYRGDETTRHDVLDGDIGLNAAGLSAWLSRRP
jgi:hypothetical protein